MIKRSKSLLLDRKHVHIPELEQDLAAHLHRSHLGENTRCCNSVHQSPLTYKWVLRQSHWESVEYRNPSCAVWSKRVWCRRPSCQTAKSLVGWWRWTTSERRRGPMFLPPLTDICRGDTQRKRTLIVVVVDQLPIETWANKSISICSYLTKYILKRRRMSCCLIAACERRAFSSFTSPNCAMNSTPERNRWWSIYSTCRSLFQRKRNKSSIHSIHTWVSQSIGIFRIRLSKRSRRRRRRRRRRQTSPTQQTTISGLRT